MQNFTFYNPVKIIFGKGEISKLSEEIPANSKVLITYGGGSIKNNGVYDQVIAALDGYTIFEFSGIEPNPKYETLMRAVALAKEKDIDFLLSVGGGSALDGTKFIAAAICFDGDPWDIVAKQAPVTKAIPLASVLTLPATGSEMNSGAVISRADSPTKLPFMSPQVFPKFSILDPETTYTLPKKQTSNGIIDTFIHVTEQYITYPVNAPLQDRIAEGILLTLLEEGPKVMQNPNDYDTRANIMWCATLALNGLISAGVPQDWATHLIGHELTARHGLDHGLTLAIVFPSLMNVMRKQKQDKLLQFATRIWGITSGSNDERIDAAIEKTRTFFETLGVKTHLSNYNIGKNTIDAIIEQLNTHGLTAIGEKQAINLDLSRKILEGCF